MKKTVFIFLITLCSTFIINAQESCSKFYPMTEGSSFQYTNYNKKGKIEGVTMYNVNAVSNIESGIKATLNFKMSDKKGKELFATDYHFTCENNIVKIDYNSLFPAHMMQRYNEMDAEMDISGSDLEIPNDLHIGQELANANVSMTMKMSGISMNITVDQTNRRVENKESITTSAGTFECYVISEVTTSKTMGTTLKINSKIWLAEGIGMVQQETYKRNGELMSRTELTQFTR